MVYIASTIAGEIVMLLVVAAAVQSHVANLERFNDWEAYKLRHGKVYETEYEEAWRRNLFEVKVRQINRFNKLDAPKLGYRKGVNHLTDRTQAEISKLNGLRIDNVKDEVYCKPSASDLAYVDKLIADKTGPVPDAHDWRQVAGRVSEVKDQGNCGSCWAFSTVGGLEGQELQQNASTKSFVGLSEQQLVDCDTRSVGCNGGFPMYAFRYIAKNQGIDDEKTYPYTSGSGKSEKCHYESSKKIMSDVGGVYLIAKDETKLKELLYKLGPITIGIDASNLESYAGGVFNDLMCLNRYQELNHGVTLVGYGTDPKQGDYWTVKNSWSDTWGEKGYFRLARNKNNMCGVAACPMFPKF